MTTKVFVNSPVAGALAALLGWFGALLFKNTMTDADFAALRFGWEGTLIGATAAACILMLVLTKGLVDPPMVVGAAVVAAIYFWDRTEFPFDTNNFRTTNQTGYWFIVSMMSLTFIMLLLGLRAARDSNDRARG